MVLLAMLQQVFNAISLFLIEFTLGVVIKHTLEKLLSVSLGREFLDCPIAVLNTLRNNENWVSIDLVVLATEDRTILSATRTKIINSLQENNDWKITYDVKLKFKFLLSDFMIWLSEICGIQEIERRVEVK